VLVVDDHALVREGTAQLLAGETGIEVVGQAGSAGQALALVGSARPDVALVDVSLPGTSGLEVAREALRLRPGLRVLMLSAYDDYAYVTEALDTGVGGYLMKTASARELRDAVRAVADGIFVLDRGISARLARRGWQQAPRASQLTPREAEVLGLLARGLSNKQAATALGLGLRTVEGHVSSVLAKLGGGSRTDAVLYALSHGMSDLADSRDGRPGEPA
jgi:DNA-binding NarL/FixJ family response regulator